MNKYHWQIKDSSLTDEQVQLFPEILPAVLQLLFNRNIQTQAEIDSFLSPDYSKDLHSPLLFSQMSKVLDRIYAARGNNEKILIYGDYDADGVCGSSILHRTFAKIGLTFQTYLPDREKEGYGLNEKAILKFVEEKIDLIITVDCGISNTPEVAFANSHGLEVIITDHHHIPEKIPQAFAIIHPSLDDKYPFKLLSGGGVAFKLACALLADPRSNLSALEIEAFEKWLLDVVAISTVADMVPLIGENRVIVKYGLMVLAKTKNFGLKKLMECAQINETKLDAYTIGFQIAPRLNAAGRMSHANTAYRLLTTENIEEAIVIAHELNRRNTERQNLTATLSDQSKKQIGEMDKAMPVAIAIGENWNKGLIGLVASKLTQEYCRPAIVLTKDATDDFYTASARSIPNFNLIEALTSVDKYFIRYGGHSGAAGFSIKLDQLEEFKAKFISLAKKSLAGYEFIPELAIDSKLTILETDWRLIDALEKFAPYGIGNSRPRFLLENVEVIVAETIGQDNSHLRLMVSSASTSVSGGKTEIIKRKIICFGFGSVCALLKPGDCLDIVCELGVNEWNGNKEIQLSLIDLKKHGQ